MTVLASVAQAQESNIAGCALVPTMGSLHQGHIQLVRRAKEMGTPVAVSIFVNPTQFGPSEDFARYPRNFEADLAILEPEGVSWVFAPSAADMYPHHTSQIKVAEVTDTFEGSLRPGHFEGVATVVCKLSQICKPASMVFGLKDLQQCAVIKRMVSDLNLSTKLIFEPTIREPDGLAMSSRNIYLSLQDRIRATQIFRQLQSCSDLLLAGSPVAECLGMSRNALIDAGAEVEYFDLIDMKTFHSTTTISTACAIIVAARVGVTRLIDNIILFPNGPML